MLTCILIASMALFPPFLFISFISISFIFLLRCYHVDVRHETMYQIGDYKYKFVLETPFLLLLFIVIFGGKGDGGVRDYSLKILLLNASIYLKSHSICIRECFHTFPLSTP